jgi:hypothetical protein
MNATPVKEKRYQAILLEWDTNTDEYDYCDNRFFDEAVADGWDTIAEFVVWLKGYETNIEAMDIIDVFSGDAQRIYNSDYDEKFSELNASALLWNADGEYLGSHNQL